MRSINIRELALESRKVCHTFVYLAKLLHSNNTKGVKEIMAYTRKNVAKVLAVQTHHCIERERFHF